VPPTKEASPTGRGIDMANLDAVENTPGSALWIVAVPDGT
jgi:hypothetical protein